MSIDGRILANVGVLAAIVESGSFARAADALGLSPSGVSRAVGRLEARVGVRLLDRTTRSVTLTDEGRRLYEDIGPLLAGIGDAVTLAAGSAAAVRGRLRVNVDAYFRGGCWRRISPRSWRAIPICRLNWRRASNSAIWLQKDSMSRCGSANRLRRRWWRASCWRRER